jgi:hypothetical protein
MCSVGDNVIIAYLVRFLSDFFNFFLLNVIYLGYEVLLRSFAWLRSVVVELCGKWFKMALLPIWCVFGRISLFSFADCNLFSLRNTPTKFRVAAFRGCRVMWEVVQDGIIAISGAFSIGFLCFLLLIVIYLAYEILLRSFAWLRSVVVELCGKWFKMTLLPYLVRFPSDFFVFFC